MAVKMTYEDCVNCNLRKNELEEKFEDIKVLFESEKSDLKEVHILISGVESDDIDLATTAFVDYRTDLYILRNWCRGFLGLIDSVIDDVNDERIKFNIYDYSENYSEIAENKYGIEYDDFVDSNYSY